MIRFVLTVLFTVVALSASAQDRRPSHCIAIAEAAPGIAYVHTASFRAPLPEYTARVSYLGHAMFLIQSPDGVSAVTDYSGFIGSADFTPDVVTMNHAHSTHWTAMPDPDIPHVLKGWGPYGQGIEHYLSVGDMLIRNVSTDIRSFGSVEELGNSIFVFEVAGLCIGHLGHLHHEPNEEQYAALGRVDVLLAPVDGGMTVDLPTMIRVVNRLKSSIVVPMHWFADGSLGRFLSGMEDAFAIEMSRDNSFEVSLRSLPERPTIRVLMPRYLTD